MGWDQGRIIAHRSSIKDMITMESVNKNEGREKKILIMLMPKRMNRQRNYPGMSCVYFS